ncbi:T9SS type A sorting domain-containing protein [Phaeodactylibacter xiamenensis]|uniref:T9SS type A sorting domain-containing protein n=1 Tax=Phaeodactylibacter xiamenensis TaxID=1524460 RepID=UPI003BAD397E
MKNTTLFFLFFSFLFSNHLVMAQSGNCTDYSLCFEKRVDSNGDTIIDVLLFNPPDSIEGLRVTVDLSSEAFDVTAFDIDTVLLVGTPIYVEGSLEDELRSENTYFDDPKIVTEDTIKLCSFTANGPPGGCIDVSFGFTNSLVSAENGFEGCAPDSLALVNCATTLCFPSVEISGVVEALVDCQDSVANDFGMRDVIVSVYQDLSSAPYDSGRTTNQGDYGVLVAPGHDYVVAPTIDTSRYIDTCGVTEVDIARIREHILGTDHFDYPYEFIAADASQDGTVNTSDLILIASAIVGDTTFFDYLGWEFILLEEYLSLDDTPLDTSAINSVSNSDTLSNLNFNASVSFIGIKIGDVNLTCSACYTPTESGSRSVDLRLLSGTSDTEKFELRFPANVNLGGTIEVPLYASDFTSEGVMGLHLWADPSYLTFEEATPAHLPEHQYFLYTVNEPDRLSMLWFNDLEGGATVDSDKPLVILKMKVHALPVEWSSAINLQNLPDRNKVYPDGTIVGHPISLKVSVQSEARTSESGLYLHKVQNPFHDELRFSVTSKVDAATNIELLNLNGEQVLQLRRILHSGRNDLILTDVSQLLSGTYLLRIVSDDGSTSTQKIIKQ